MVQFREQSERVGEEDAGSLFAFVPAAIDAFKLLACSEAFQLSLGRDGGSVFLTMMAVAVGFLLHNTKVCVCMACQRCLNATLKGVDNHFFVVN